MASRIASAAFGEIPKALSFAPTRTRNASPRRRSSVSGPTKGIVAGRLSTSLVKRGAVVIVSGSCEMEREDTPRVYRDHEIAEAAPGSPWAPSGCVERPTVHPPSSTPSTGVRSAGVVIGSSARIEGYNREQDADGADRMKILFADVFPPSRLERLRGEGHECELAPALTGDCLPGAMPGFEALVVRSTRVGATALEAGDALKLVVRAGAGTNTIDTGRARALGIDVCNVPGANALAVARADPGG